jgi:hypothetical protein
MRNFFTFLPLLVLAYSAYWPIHQPACFHSFPLLFRRPVRTSLLGRPSWATAAAAQATRTHALSLPLVR